MGHAHGVPHPHLQPEGPRATDRVAGNAQVLGHICQHSLSGEVLRGTVKLAGAYEFL